jgi:hypothetical protein
MSIISSSPTLSHPKGSSASQNTSVGSGSRPTASSHKIPSSAPSEPRTLGRAPQGWLGDTQKKEAPFS